MDLSIQFTMVVENNAKIVNGSVNEVCKWISIKELNETLVIQFMENQLILINYLHVDSHHLLHRNRLPLNTLVQRTKKDSKAQYFTEGKKIQ